MCSRPVYKDGRECRNGNHLECLNPLRMISVVVFVVLAKGTNSLGVYCIAKPDIFKLLFVHR
jgi:hypothetical protein